jgi:hypothetical protein
MSRSISRGAWSARPVYRWNLIDVDRMSTGSGPTAAVNAGISWDFRVSGVLSPVVLGQGASPARTISALLPTEWPAILCRLGRSAFPQAHGLQRFPALDPLRQCTANLCDEASLILGISQSS